MRIGEVNVSRAFLWSVPRRYSEFSSCYVELWSGPLSLRQHHRLDTPRLDWSRVPAQQRLSHSVARRSQALESFRLQDAAKRIPAHCPGLRAGRERAGAMEGAG